jgi:hypothetical protein
MSSAASEDLHGEEVLGGGRQAGRRCAGRPRGRRLPSDLLQRSWRMAARRSSSCRAPLGLGFADLERADKGGQLVLQRDPAGIALPEDRLLLPSPRPLTVTVTSSPPEAVKYLFTVVRSVRLGYSVWVVKAKHGRPRSSRSRTVTLASREAA